jgi:hypothetical protein
MGAGSVASVSERDGMTEYRAYVIGRDGHVARYEPLICANDAVAIAQAKARLPGQAIELWSGTRFVARVAAES